MLNLFKKKEKKVVLYRPLSGKVIDITEAPDEVFSQKYLGDGLAVIPEGDVVVAPCDGTVLHIANSLHAVAVGTEEGLEVLIHIGLDTVLLKGKGFTGFVKNGDLVKKGDKLVSFDRSYIEAQGKSLITPIVITNMAEKVKGITKHKEFSTEVLMEVYLK